MNNLYCEFEKTGAKFKEKDIYKCKHCDIQLLLEEPEKARVICFAKREIINKAIDPDMPETMAGLTTENFAQHALEMALKGNTGGENLLADIQRIKDQTNPDNLCTQEDINHRLSICKSCEYYENDSCLLCGCVIVREANYKNKLAQKNQVCPAGKWGQIKD